MGTNFYWNTEDPKVLETITSLGDWRAPLRSSYSDGIPRVTEEQIEQVRQRGMPELILNMLANPEPASLAEYSHIGKRSAAGLYCYRCNSWFNDPANCDSRHINDRKTCKYCGDAFQEQMTRSAAIELGFSVDTEAPYVRPESGVNGTCAFSWANWPDEVYRIASQAPSDMPLVIDEYGRTMTGAEFIDMMRREVNITQIAIGRIFS